MSLGAASRGSVRSSASAEVAARPSRTASDVMAEEDRRHDSDREGEEEEETVPAVELDFDDMELEFQEVSLLTDRPWGGL